MKNNYDKCKISNLDFDNYKFIQINNGTFHSLTILKGRIRNIFGS
jgi:hypothetical protein